MAFVALVQGHSISLLPIERIERKIFSVRGRKVLFDKDLASLYGVSTSALNRAVARNLERFPSDFMISLTKEEFAGLMFHFGTSSWGGTRKPPRAFTEQGVAMLSGILRSRRAVQVNIAIMRAFVRLREFLASNENLARRLDELEKKTDARFQAVFDAIEALSRPQPEPEKPPIGFRRLEKRGEEGESPPK